MRSPSWKSAREAGLSGLDRFHHQPGLEVDDVEPEVAAAGEHLPDGSLAFGRRNMALRFLRDGDDRDRKSGSDCNCFQEMGRHAETVTTRPGQL